MLVPNLPFDQYRERPGLSKSELTKFAISPKHYISNIDAHERTASQSLGTAVHAVILEPKKFQETYLALPADTKLNTKEGKEAKKKIEELGYVALKLEDWNTIDEMRLAVQEHFTANKLVQDLIVEASLFWKDEVSGLDLKGRCDGISTKYKTIIDIKTSSSFVSKDSFRYEVKKYKYHWQAAMYLAGAKACGLDVNDFVFIAVESCPPYNVACYRIGQESLILAWEQMRPLLEQFKKCKESSSWPGYSDYVEDLNLLEAE